MWMLRAFLRGTDPLAARANAVKESSYDEDDDDDDDYNYDHHNMMMEMVSLKVSHSQLLEVVGKLSLHSQPSPTLFQPRCSCLVFIGLDDDNDDHDVDNGLSS